VVQNAGFYLKAYLPGWLPVWAHNFFRSFCDTLGLPHIYTPTDYTAISWSHDAAAVLVGVALYVVALIVIAYGCSVWYSGNVLTYAVLAKKKDDKDILELPEDEEDLIKPVVPPPPGQEDLASAPSATPPEAPPEKDEGV
jgi:hypothetical protein